MKLETTIKEDLPRLLMDKEKMKIAFLNIFINAIEAMKPGHGILSIIAEKMDTKIIVKVSDNGKGIEEENLDKLFDPFYTAKQGGMGLGLTTTQSIFNSHKIDVEVTSQLDVGTTFHIIFNLPE